MSRESLELESTHLDIQSTSKIHIMLGYKQISTNMCLFNPHTTINSADFRLRLAADPFIVAIVKPDFEDGLKMEVFPGGYWRQHLI